MAIYETDLNPIAFIFSGAYSVDWGDGTSDSYASGATAEHNYEWADIPSSTLTSEGFRQVLIRVYCTTDTMRTINFNVRHTAVSNSNASTGILDIVGNYVTITSLIFAGPSYNILHTNITRIDLIGSIASAALSSLCYSMPNCGI
jgi:hypothetical protein